MVEPIRPQDVKPTKPDEVIEAFNELIQKHWDGTRSQFTQDEVIKMIGIKIRKTPKFIFDHHYMDIEDLYRQSGWMVEYDKPGYNESYPPTFTFSKKEVKNDHL